MTNLIKYESARFALQQAAEIDEVKDIRDKAQAMSAYAKQANDTKLVEWATEIKVRAERKAGQMLADMPKQHGARGTGSNQYKEVGSHDATPPKTLEELGINKTQSSRWQKLASVPDDKFEQAVAAAKDVAGEVTTAAMLRIEKQNRSSEDVVVKKSKSVSEQEEKLSTGNQEEYDQKEDQIKQLSDEILSLDEENEQLRDAIAANQLPTDKDIRSAKEIISELRSKIRTLEATLDAVKSSRDSYLRENEQLKNQCAMQRKQLKKMGAEIA